MKTTSCSKPYQFTQTFLKRFPENTGISLDDDILMEIKASIATMNPYRKIDNKGRDSEYFTFSICGILVTIVCSADTHKILTGIIETHDRPQFRRR